MTFHTRTATASALVLAAVLALPAAAQPLRPPKLPQIKGPRGAVPGAPPAQPAQPPGPSLAATPPKKDIKNPDASKKGKFKLDFEKAELIDIVKTMSEWTQKNFIITEQFRGRITLISPVEVTADEAYAAFHAALQANGWTIYPVGKFFKVAQMKDSIRSNIPTLLSGEPYPETEQMITKLLRMKHSDPNEIKQTLEQFKGRDGEIWPVAPDILIISDLGLNIRRLEKIIEQIDQPGGADEIRVVQINYASAQEVGDKLLQIFQAAGRPGAAPVTAGARPPGTPGQGADGGVAISKIIPDERTNKIIVIASSKSFQRINELIRQLDVPVGEGGVRVYYLRHAKSEDIAQTLQALASGQASRPKSAPGTPKPVGGAAGGGGSAELFQGEVKITADKNTNSLVIIASQSDYQNIVKVIQMLDVPRRQVFIEAVIMEINLSADTRFNVNSHLGMLIDDVSFRGSTADVPLVFGSTPTQGRSSLLPNIVQLAGLGGFLAGLQGPPVTISEGVTLPAFGILVNALQTDSDVNVLSTPHILTSDNEEAEISVGQNVPFQSGFAPSNISSLLGSAGSTTSSTGTPSLSNLSGLLGGGLSSFFAPIQRQNVELRLKIKPQINEHDMVRLEIDEQTEEIAGKDPTLGPTTAKRSIKTSVVTKDQQTVVIGGLIQERTTNSVSKIPILGSIPILGWLFRDTNTTKTRTNLLLFLTPYVIRDQSDFRRLFERKMKEREEFAKRFIGGTAEYEVSIDYARKTGPVSAMDRTLKREMTKAENGGEGAPGETLVTPPPAEAIPVPKGEIAPGQPGEGTPPPPPPQGEPPVLQIPEVGPGGELPPVPIPVTPEGEDQ